MAPAGFCKAEVEQEDGPASLPPGEYPSRHLSSGQCFKPASESFHIIWALSKGCFYAGLWGGWVYVSPLRASPQFTAIPFSHGCEPRWSSKPGVLGACLPGASLKSWGALVWGLNPLLLKEKLQFWVSFWLWVGAGCMVRLCLSLSYQLWCGLPDVKGLLLQFLVFFPWEEMFSYIAVDSVCPWEKVSMRSSYVTILSQNSAFAFRRGFIFGYIQLRAGLSLQMMWSSPQ